MLLLFLAYALRVPLGIDNYVPAPASNPITKESAALGRKLFFDKRLSRDGTVSCATCHDPQYGFTDKHPKAVGIENKVGPRRTPRILNRAWGKRFFWDGRAPDLEHQVAQPIANPSEMDMPVAKVVARLAAIDEYKGIDEKGLRFALASYVRTILAGNSPYDRYLAGDNSALTAEQQVGLNLFRGKAGCISCHLGPNLTDEGFHVTAAGAIDDDAGHSLVSFDDNDNAAFKTPSLRHVAATPPYFHDGSAKTLDDVIDHYAKGGKPRKNLDPEIRKFSITPEEKRALVRFLEALTGEIREGYPE